MQRTRAWRRHQTKRVQRRRLKHWLRLWNSEHTVRCIGKLKKDNFSCGCPMCKPWKHGLDTKLKFSEIKQLVGWDDMFTGGG